MEEQYYYWLDNVSGIGRVSMKKIISCMTPEEMYRYYGEKDCSFLTAKQKENIRESREKWQVEKEWEQMQKHKIALLILGRKNYPFRLSGISDPPVVLYCKGKTEVFEKPAVAVVGSRACSAYGSLAAKELGRHLAEQGIVTVSGMARGIDGVSQWAALENRGESIGVLASGVEVCYPPENRFLYERLPEQGCLVSENPPLTAPNAGLFPLRNRIISGLADVVVVVEAREKSGTLITVDMALEQGKEVYAIPGRMTDTVSRGCNQLIRQGAGLVLSPREFMEEIAPILKKKITGKPNVWKEDCRAEERLILESLDVSMLSLEEIYQNAAKKDPSITLARVMETVLELQMKKEIREENGYYVCEKIPVAT